MRAQTVTVYFDGWSKEFGPSQPGNTFTVDVTGGALLIKDENVVAGSVKNYTFSLFRISGYAIEQ